MSAGAAAYVLRVGPSGLFGYVFIPGTDIGLHTYSVMLYSSVAGFLQIKWGTKMPAIMVLLWGINEFTFDSIYPPFHPYIYDVLLQPQHLIYINVMLVFIVFGWNISKPKIKIGILTFVFPAFLIIWGTFGMPLIYTLPYTPAVYSNWRWEVGYQIALIGSFLYTFRPHESIERPEVIRGPKKASYSELRHRGWVPSGDEEFGDSGQPTWEAPSIRNEHIQRATFPRWKFRQRDRPGTDRALPVQRATIHPLRDKAGSDL